MTTDYQYDLRPGCTAGSVVTLAPDIRRVIADNPSPMTFTGTATYLLGHGSVAVIDPGPKDPAHVNRILRALRKGERIEAIFVTHRHLDHSPGASMLRYRIGAPIHAALPGPTAWASAPPPGLLAAHPGGGEGLDRDFVPDGIMEDGERFESVERTGGRPGWALRAVHTPGHLDDHVCYASEDTGDLFTGDHVMGWSSTVVSPPEGDNGAYVDSLVRLLRRFEKGLDRTYYPGHGHPVARPDRLVRHLLQRRRQRDAQILSALAHGPRDIDGLLRLGYPELGGIRAYAARRMILAHLIHLERQGRILMDSGPDRPVRFALREGEAQRG